MSGLKTCTRFRAMMERRSRRISSSLLPENMGPQIASIQPRLPVTISIHSQPHLIMRECKGRVPVAGSVLKERHIMPEMLDHAPPDVARASLRDLARVNRY